MAVAQPSAADALIQGAADQDAILHPRTPRYPVLAVATHMKITTAALVDVLANRFSHTWQSGQE